MLLILDVALLFALIAMLLHDVHAASSSDQFIRSEMALQWSKVFGIFAVVLVVVDIAKLFA